MQGNVAFSSAQSGWSFTLQSFAQLYGDVFGVKIETAEFARWAHRRFKCPLAACL